MDEVQIENGFPVPPLRAPNETPTSKYTIACTGLAIGQSFTVEGKKEKDRARGAAARVKEKYHREFTMRRVNDNKWRLWRIK